MSDVRNVIIVGSGPAALTAAIYTARANLAPLVIESAYVELGFLAREGVDHHPQVSRIGADTLDRVNAADLKPSDTVRFRRGETPRQGRGVPALRRGPSARTMP